MYAHIYRSNMKGFWQLLITSGASLTDGVIETRTYRSKLAAKQAAKRFGATAWNY